MKIHGTHGSRYVALTDLFLLGALVWVGLVWLFDPLVITVGAIASQTFRWSLPPVLLVLGLVLLRLALWWLACRHGMPARGLWAKKWYQQTALLVGTLYFVLGGGELCLYAVGFKYATPPVVFEGGRQNGGREIEDCLPDPELLWKFIPGGMFQGRRINLLGFRDREIQPQKPPGVKRVMCMGDSVTAQGRPSYAEYLNELLNAHPPTTNAWEAFNVGVHGYCSLQGRVLLRQVGPVLSPDIVTIFFGWNDHWRCRVPLREQMARRVPSAVGPIIERLQNKRFFMWLVKLLQRPVPPSWHATNLRVSPDEYAWALADMIVYARSINSLPVLITAPRSRLSMHIVQKGYAKTQADAERIHDEYVDITRRVAAEQKVHLLDLAALLSGPESAPLFSCDGIHFDSYKSEGSMVADPADQPGLRRVAQELDKCIREVVQGDEWRQSEK